MARGNDKGKDFDQQFDHSRRIGKERAARGEGPWALDKQLNDLRNQGSSGGGNEGCSDKAGALVVLFVTAGAVLNEAVSRFI